MSVEQTSSIWLTTAGEGTWMLATERGRMWLARWHNTTPSIKAAPTSSGNKTFNLDSRFCQHKTTLFTNHVKNVIMKEHHMIKCCVTCFTYCFARFVMFLLLIYKGLWFCLQSCCYCKHSWNDRDLHAMTLDEYQLLAKIKQTFLRSLV